MNNTEISADKNTEQMQNLSTLLTKLHRAYGKQKNKSYENSVTKLEYEGGYNAVKITLLSFENIATVEEFKRLVKQETTRYKDIVDKAIDIDSDEYHRNVGSVDAFRQILAAIIFIDELDVDNHHVLRNEIINFKYANV